jgi:hypothetical protein
MRPSGICASLEARGTGSLHASADAPNACTTFVVPCSEHGRASVTSRRASSPCGLPACNRASMDVSCSSWPTNSSGAAPAGTSPRGGVHMVLDDGMPFDLRLASSRGNAAWPARMHGVESSGITSRPWTPCGRTRQSAQTCSRISSRCARGSSCGSIPRATSRTLASAAGPLLQASLWPWCSICRKRWPCSRAACDGLARTIEASQYTQPRPATAMLARPDRLRSSRPHRPRQREPSRPALKDRHETVRALPAVLGRS